MSKRWTAEEIDYLETNVGKIKIPTMAKKINRSVYAIEMKLSRLGLYNTRLESGRLTVGELANILHTDNHVVSNWIQEHGLKAVKRITKIKRVYYLVDTEEFWKWAENNKQRIDFYRIEPKILVPEPIWVDVDRKKDYQNIPRMRHKKWCVKEDEKLIWLLGQGHSRMEMANVLKRSGNAVQRRISRLRTAGKLPMIKPMVKWSEKEIKLFLELEEQGLTDKEIANELGRDSDHIRWKRGNLRRNGLYRGRKKQAS